MNAYTVSSFTKQNDSFISIEHYQPVKNLKGYLPIIGIYSAVQRIFQAVKEIFCLIRNSSCNYEAYAAALKNLCRGFVELVPVIGGLTLLIYDFARTHISYASSINRQIKDEDDIMGIAIDSEIVAKLSLNAVEPYLRTILSNKEFLKDFEKLQLVFGLTRRMGEKYILSFARVWHDSSLRVEINEWIHCAQLARNKSLNKLRQGEYPSPDGQCQDVINRVFTLIDKIHSDEDRQNVSKLFQAIYFNRCCMDNTQLHTDGLDLAFGALVTRGVSERERYNSANSLERYEKEKRALQTQINSVAPTEEEKIAQMLQKLQHLKGYYKMDGFLLQRPGWEPIIGPMDPIKPLVRCIGVATLEGKKNESRILLDFTKALGENFIPSSDGRLMLSHLLTVCDHYFVVNVCDWKGVDINDLSKEIQEAVTQIGAHSDFQHLSQQQKKDIVIESLRFAKEANMALAHNLLTLE